MRKTKYLRYRRILGLVKARELCLRSGCQNRGFEKHTEKQLARAPFFYSSGFLGPTKLVTGIPEKILRATR